MNFLWCIWIPTEPIEPHQDVDWIHVEFHGPMEPIDSLLNSHWLPVGFPTHVIEHKWYVCWIPTDSHLNSCWGQMKSPVDPRRVAIRLQSNSNLGSIWIPIVLSLSSHWIPIQSLVRSHLIPNGSLLIPCLNSCYVLLHTHIFATRTKAIATHPR